MGIRLVASLSVCLFFLISCGHSGNQSSGSSAAPNSSTSTTSSSGGGQSSSTSGGSGQGGSGQGGSGQGGSGKSTNSPRVHYMMTKSALKKAASGKSKSMRRSGASAFTPDPSQLLYYLGGPVLTVTQVQAIFWGANWNNSSFAQDKITGLNQFFTDLGSSPYLGTVAEYLNPSGIATSSFTYLGKQLDTDASNPAPADAFFTAETAIKEICHLTSGKPASNTVYMIFTDGKLDLQDNQYCAYHGWGQCDNGALMQYAYIPNLDGITDCDPGDYGPGATGHSQGLAAIANVAAHELAEAITDPTIDAWQDPAGQENGDKCSFTFSSSSTMIGSVPWKIQEEWSNALYNQGAGDPNAFGDPGCTNGSPSTGPSPSPTGGPLPGPTISGLGVSAGASTAMFTWTTDTPSDTEVYFGTDPNNIDQGALNSEPVTSHSIVIGVQPNTTYYFEVDSVDANGGIATPVTGKFTTSASGGGGTSSVDTVTIAVSGRDGSGNPRAFIGTTNEPKGGATVLTLKLKLAGATVWSAAMSYNASAGNYSISIPNSDAVLVGAGALTVEIDSSLGGIAQYP